MLSYTSLYVICAYIIIDTERVLDVLSRKASKSESVFLQCTKQIHLSILYIQQTCIILQVHHIMDWIPNKQQLTQGKTYKSLLLVYLYSVK